MSTICKNTGNRQELPCINCTCESSSSTAELGGLLGRNSLRPKIRGQELTLHLALHILRNPFPFDQRERDLVRLWAADELERLSVLCMQSNHEITGPNGPGA